MHGCTWDERWVRDRGFAGVEAKASCEGGVWVEVRVGCA